MEANELARFVRDIVYAHVPETEEGLSTAVFVLTTNVMALLRAGQIPVEDYIDILRNWGENVAKREKSA